MRELEYSLDCILFPEYRGSDSDKDNYLFVRVFTPPTAEARIVRPKVRTREHVTGCAVP